MSKRIIIIILVVLFGILSGVLVFKIQHKRMISQGELLLQKGKYQDIFDLLGKKIAGNSGSATERILAAKAYYRLNQYDKAMEILQPLLVYGQDNEDALQLAGWMLIKKNNLTSAEEKFTILKQKSDNGYPDIGMGAIALLQSEGYKKAELSEAEKYFATAQQKVNDVPELFLYLAELKLVQHNYSAAAEAAENAVKISPRWSEPYVMLGRCYLLSGDYSKAEKAFQDSLENGASEEDTKFFLAQSTYLQGRLRDAVDIMNQIAGLKGAKARDAKENAAKILLALQETEPAEKLLREAWEERKSPQTGIQLYSVLSRMGKMDQAKDILNFLVNNRPFLSETQLEYANLLYRENSFQNAYYAYQQVLDNIPHNFWAEYNLGCLALTQRDSKQAPDFFNSALQDYPGFFPAQINLAYSQFTSEEFNPDVPIFDELKKQYPDNMYATQVDALKDFYQGNAEKAILSLKTALVKDDSNDKGHILLGEIYMRLFQYQEAKDHFDKALAASPGSLRAKVGKAHASYRLGDVEEAAQIYKELSTTDFSSYQTLAAEIKNGNALILLSEGKVSEALNLWDVMKNDSDFGRSIATANAAMTDPANPSESDTAELEKASAEKVALPEAQYNLALYKEKMGNQLEAIQQYEMLVEKYPSFLPGLYNLSDLYRKRGKYESAVDYYEKTAKASPGRADIYNNEAAVYVKMGKPGKAEELLQLAIQKNPNSNEIRFNQALAALHEGNLIKAQKYLDDLVKMGTPKNTVNIINGLMLAEQNKWKEAEQAFADAKGKSYQDVYVALNHGIALAKLERYSEAEQSLREAISLDPSLAASHRALGLLYCKLGLFEEAQDLLQASLRLDSSQAGLQKIIEQIQNWMNDK